MKGKLQQLYSFILLILFLGWSNIVTSQITAGIHTIYFICADSSGMAIGSNDNGELGIGNNTDQPVPISLTTNNIKTVAGGFGYALYLKHDGTVWASGANYQGQLGIGNNTAQNTPQLISNLSGIIAVSAAQGSSLFLKNDGTVWSTGGNYYGQLGDGTTTDRNTPAQIPSLSNIVAIASGGNHSLFLKNDGTVWACGYNYHGQLGNGSSGSFGSNTIITQVNVVSNIVAIVGGGYHSLFIKNDGTVWGTGGNNYGDLGDGTTINRPTPQLISGLTGIIDVAAGDNHSVFLKNDGTAYSCGLNFDGQLGDGTNTNRTTVVQINTLSGITVITAGYAHSAFLKNDQTVLSTGSNPTGVMSTIPVQITGICAIDIPTELNDVANINDFVKISPNPSYGIAKIEWSGNKNASLKVFNIVGEEVLQKQISNEIDLSNFPKGIYFVKIYDGKKTYTEKIMLQ